jgi:hypothetical protein
VVPQLQTSPPPPESELIHTWILDDSTQLRQLRSALQQALTGHPLVAGDTFSLDVGWYATDTAKHIWATFPIHP